MKREDKRYEYLVHVIGTIIIENKERSAFSIADKIISKIEESYLFKKRGKNTFDYKFDTSTYKKLS
jgi:hypothetical protein